MTHLADGGNPTPIMEWIDNPPFLMEGVTSTLLTEIKGGSVNHGERHDDSPGSKGLWPTFPQEGSLNDSPSRGRGLNPFMEWDNNPPFLREGVTSTLLTEIKGVIKSQGKSQ